MFRFFCWSRTKLPKIEQQVCIVRKFELTNIGLHAFLLEIMIKIILKVFYFDFIFLELFGVVLTGVYIDIVGTDVNMILHAGFLEGGWGVITRRGIFWIAS